MIIQTMLEKDTKIKSHSEHLNNFKVCQNHAHQVVYPIEYDDCPACGNEKITRVTLGFD